MLFVSARIKDRNKVVKTISEKQIKQNSRKEAVMMKEDKVMQKKLPEPCATGRLKIHRSEFCIPI